MVRPPRLPLSRRTRRHDVMPCDVLRYDEFRHAKPGHDELYDNAHSRHPPRTWHWLLHAHLLPLRPLGQPLGLARTRIWTWTRDADDEFLRGNDVVC